MEAPKTTWWCPKITDWSTSLECDWREDIQHEPIVVKIKEARMKIHRWTRSIFNLKVTWTRTDKVVFNAIHSQQEEEGCLGQIPLENLEILGQCLHSELGMAFGDPQWSTEQVKEGGFLDSQAKKTGLDCCSWEVDFGRGMSMKMSPNLFLSEERVDRGCQKTFAFTEVFHASRSEQIGRIKIHFIRKP